MKLKDNNLKAKSGISTCAKIKFTCTYFNIYINSSGDALLKKMFQSISEFLHEILLYLVFEDMWKSRKAWSLVQMMVMVIKQK